MSGPPPEPPSDSPELELLQGADGGLLDLVDHLLNQGVVVTGEVVLGIADIDLVYLRITALLCAADRVLPPRPERAPDRLSDRPSARPPEPSPFGQLGRAPRPVAPAAPPVGALGPSGVPSPGPLSRTPEPPETPPLARTPRGPARRPDVGHGNPEE